MSGDPTSDAWSSKSKAYWTLWLGVVVVTIYWHNHRLDFLLVLPGVCPGQVPPAETLIWQWVDPWPSPGPWPDLVHQGVGRLVRHLVAANYYQCSHLWLVRNLTDPVYPGLFYKQLRYWFINWLIDSVIFFLQIFKSLSRPNRKS